MDEPVTGSSEVAFSGPWASALVMTGNYTRAENDTADGYNEVKIAKNCTL